LNYHQECRFDYDFLEVPPPTPPPTIENIVGTTSSPSVSKITINSEYKYMAFTYTTGATNTTYTITFHENTECDILAVGGGGGGDRRGAGGGGAGTFIYRKNQVLNWYIY